MNISSFLSCFSLEGKIVILVVVYCLIMSGSGKGLLGVWLYRRGDNWAIKEGSPIHKSSDVCIRNWLYIYIYSCIYLLFYFSFLIHGRVFSFSRKIVIIDFLLMVYNVNK